MSESTINPYISAGIGTATGIANNIMAAGRENAQRKWVEKMTQEQREWDLNMWNKTNEYNTPANQIARMHEAGLNPMYFGLDGSSAGAMSAASPVGMPNTGTTDIANPMEAFAAAKMHNKQMELMNSEIDKNKATTTGFTLDNEFKEKTMNARVEGQNIANNLSKEQIKNLETQRDEMREHINTMITQSNTEIEKQGLIKAQKWLANAQAKQIYELLPYEKLFKEASTEAQKAAAASAFANAAYQNGLIEKGYLDALVEKAKAESKSAEAIAEINRFASDVKNGTLFTFKGQPGEYGKGFAGFSNTLISTLSTLSQAIGGGLGGLLKP